MEVFVQQLINGITLGSIYGLIAIGYTMVFGIIGMVNFAHGDVFMVSAFIALITYLIVTAWLGIGSVVAALVIVLVVAMVLTSVVGGLLLGASMLLKLPEHVFAYEVLMVLGEAFVGRRRRFRVGVHYRLQHVVDLLVERVGELRIRDEIGGQPAGHRIPQSRYAVIKALILFFGCHGGLLDLQLFLLRDFCRQRASNDAQ